MRWQMSFDFCRRTTYLFCTNIYCSNLHTPEHHLEKVWSWWRESSASKSYLYQPVRSTDSCPHIGKVQHTVPEEPIVRLLRKPKSANSQQYAPCPPFFTCESSGQPWSGQWCDSVPDVTTRRTLHHWWATWWSPQLSPHPVGNLSGCTFWHLWSCKPEERGLGGVLWLWCDHLCLANLPNWYASSDQGQEVEYTLRSKTLKQPPLQKLKPNLSSIQS